MNFISKRNLVYRILVTVLSLISSASLVYVLVKEIAQDRLIQGPHMPYAPSIIYIASFIIIAILHWFSQNKIIKVLQYVLLITLLFFTVSSGLTAYPAELLVIKSHAFYIFIEILLPLTVILNFIYLNLGSFGNDKKKALLFLLKFINTLFAVGAGFYLFLVISISGNMFLVMNQTQRNWAVFGMFMWILVNLIYGVFIWFSAYRSWWAWLGSIILAVEICIPVIYAYQAELWQGIIAAAFVLILLFAMTYLNNKVVKEDK